MSDNSKVTAGARANMAAFSEPEREIARLRKLTQFDPDPHVPRHGVSAGEWIGEKDLYGMPAHPGLQCPVEPIGYEGELFYVIDSRGQFRALKAEKFNQVGIQDLFAATPNYPKFIHPRRSKPVFAKDGKTIVKEPEIVSFEADDIKEMLFYACSLKGYFSPENKMRGRGAWTMRSGNIRYHTGDALWKIERGKFVEQPTGVHEGHLYPHLSALPAPWTQPITAQDNPARALLTGFRKTNWTRPDVDPILLLGWIGGAYLGGALNWRPSVLLLGDRGTGKSTVNDMLHSLFGDALFHSSDSTAAGIYQAMGHDSRAVALDEMEPDMDSRKAENVADLMRSSASGAIGRRGSSGGAASSYQMRSAFLFSAINNPLHKASDLSRVAILRVLPFSKDSEKPTPINADTAGPMVLAQMMRAWGDNGQGFKDQFNRFADALKQGGHDKRGQDTYGTLLACAAMLLGDELSTEMDAHLGPEEERWWIEKLGYASIPETANSSPNYRDCMDRILTTPVRDWRQSTYNTIGQVIHGLRTTDDDGQAIEGGPVIDKDKAKSEINIAGFGLMNVREVVVPIMRRAAKAGMPMKVEDALRQYGLPEAGYVLAVPNKSNKVSKHLEGSSWQQGGWNDALRQCPHPGVMIGDADINRVTIDGVQQRCTLVVLDRYHQAPEK